MANYIEQSMVALEQGKFTRINPEKTGRISKAPRSKNILPRQDNNQL